MCLSTLTEIAEKVKLRGGLRTIRVNCRGSHFPGCYAPGCCSGRSRRSQGPLGGLGPVVRGYPVPAYLPAILRLPWL